MRDSFRQIAQFMDSVEPPDSLRRLLEMHQIEEGTAGLAEVWRRHNHPDLREKRFLFLNTFLMDFLRGPTPDSNLGRWILGVVTGTISEIARLHEELTAKFGKAVVRRFVKSPHDVPFKPAVEARAKLDFIQF